MKRAFSIIIVFLIAVQTAFAASPVYLPDEILQGATFTVEVPQFEIKDISGIFDGRTIKFYEVEHAPNWDEPISRAEFLKELFDNHDFGIIVDKGYEDFPDVSKDNPFYDYIEKARNLGIISGYEDGSFGPYDAITRSHIAKILVEAFKPKQDEGQAADFPDVLPEHWHYQYIKDAVNAGYFKGYPDGLMRPDRNINFQEAEIVITRAAVPVDFKQIDSKQYYKAFVGVYRLTEPGQKTLKIITENKNDDFTINVLRRDVPTESFSLPASKTELLGQTQVDTTWDMINAAKANPTPEILWDGAFIVPTEGTITLGFGDKLYINGVFSGSHFGLDYANAEGTPIYASNDGIVTLADETMSYGNTVIIDHGENIFTMYLHMSELKINAGDNVKKGDLIGLMGQTGVATGPHLHFTVFAGDVIVDNYEWYEGKF